MLTQMFDLESLVNNLAIWRFIFLTCAVGLCWEVRLNQNIAFVCLLLSFKWNIKLVKLTKVAITINYIVEILKD